MKISARIPILEAFSSAKTRNAPVFAPLSRFSQAFPASLEFENVGKRNSPLSVKFETDIQDRQSRLFSMTVYETIHKRKQAKKAKRSRLEAESSRLTGRRVAPVFTCPWGQARYHGLKATPRPINAAHPIGCILEKITHPLPCFFPASDIQFRDKSARYCFKAEICP